MKAFLRILPRPGRGKALVPTQSSAPLVLFLHTFPSLVWGRDYAPSSRIEGTLFSYGIAVEEEKSRDLAIPVQLVVARINP
jgi:hypothetical protein